LYCKLIHVSDESEEQTMTTSSTQPDRPDVPGPIDPAASLDALESQQRRTVRGLTPSPLGLYLPWGLGYVVAFGAAWLASGPDAVVSGTVAAVLIAVAALIPLVGSAVTLSRSGRGLAGPSRRVGAMYGWSWILGFVALTLINLRLSAAGLPPETMSLLWSGDALVLVGVLFLAGGLLWPGSGQYVLGVWILVSAVVAVLVGYPSNFLVLALLGGGGLVVTAVVMHHRLRRA